MKKVLVITYYWPPSGGAGVQRWLKFVKYLRDFGWEPVVYTPENPEAPVIDHSLEKDIPEGLEVLRQPIWEPYTAYKKFIGQKKDQRVNAGFLSESEKPKFSENLSVWIRGNFFIPDARKFWIKPSVRYLTKYLKEKWVDAIVSTGPPHSMHMIALRLKEKLGIPWLADFRDPWTNIDFYDQLKLSKFADRTHKKMELSVLKYVDEVITVSWNWADDFRKIYERPVKVITNGYDPDDFELDVSLDKKFSIVHIGAMNKDRNPVMFFEVCGELLTEYPSLAENLEIKLVGSTDISVFNSIEKQGLTDFVKWVKNVPHDEVLKYTKSAQLLLLALNNTPNVLGIIPGKIFEYLAAKRPILCTGPENGDSARIIRNANAGEIVSFDDKNKMRKVLVEYYEAYQNNDLVYNGKGIEKYSRKALCGEIADLLNSIRKK
ncbi:MAG: glycosyltransferase [Bacteroidota bacterium]|nr:glycosyltransferase [Bacteroidota bacterium]